MEWPVGTVGTEEQLQEHSRKTMADNSWFNISKRRICRMILDITIKNNCICVTMCLRVCVCVRSCGCMCSHACGDWRLTSGVSLAASTLIFETEFFTEPGTHPFHHAGFSHLCLLHFGIIDPHCSRLIMGTRDLKSVFHAWSTGNLPSEPSPQPQGLNLWSYWYTDVFDLAITDYIHKHYVFVKF